MAPRGTAARQVHAAQKAQAARFATDSLSEFGPPSSTTSVAPSWSYKFKRVAAIGAHVFYSAK